jgi:HEAT repeat protein
MTNNIASLLEQLTGEISDNTYEASDSLGHIGTEETVIELVKLLKHSNSESRILAARTLGLVKNNRMGLDPLLEAIAEPENASYAGELLVALEGFDVSGNYVDLFKLYLFGGFKVSMFAKELLDYKEFDITPRVLKKSLKHWNHYTNNIKQDEVYQLRKIEVEEILNDLKEYIDDQES